jgi:DNA-binding CsgD family transcriptional regulator/tetratricopeptide (TPR) repeat protein
VQLFVDRAQAVDPRFVLDSSNATAIADICCHLDGLPLAIELAAARTLTLSPAALLSRFDRALPYLIEGPQDAPDRLRTMRQAIAWSYDLLSPGEQSLFRRLAVFVGGFTLEAAEWVAGCQDTLSPSVLPGVSALVDHSLLRRIEGHDGESRFAMLETVREFGLDQLAANEEEDEIRDAHAAYFLALAEQAEPELQDAAWESWVDRLVIELPNLRAALSYYRDQGDGEGAVRVAGALGLFWTLPSYIREGRAWLEMAIALPNAGHVPTSLAKALNAIGVVAQWQNDYAGGRRALTRALAIRHGLDDELGVAEVLGNLGNVALDTGNFDQAESLLVKSLPLYESNGKFFWVGETFIHLGHTVRARGEHARSIGYHQEAVAIMRQLPGKNKLSDALVYLGWAEVVGGDLARARLAYAEGLALAQADGDRMRLGRCVCGAAGIAALEGDPVLAARLFAAATAQRNREQILLKPTIQAEHDRLIATVREALGEDPFASAWSEGDSLRLEEAVAAAQTVFEDVGAAETPLSPRALATPVPSGAKCHLTSREREVLQLLVIGQSDKEIAAALGVRRRTVSNYVAEIRAKLDAPSRTAAATIALRDGLVRS